MKTLSWILTLMVICLSCNPVKKVLRDPAKTQQVVNHWLLFNHVPDDSTVISIIADTTASEVIYDTTYLVQDGACSDTTITITKKITYRIRTSRTITITKTTVINGLKDMVKGMQGEIKASNERNAIDRKEKNMWMWIAIAACAILLGIGALKIYKSISVTKILPI